MDDTGERSWLQRNTIRYYELGLRELYFGRIFSTPKRRSEELGRKKFSNANVAGADNINSFIKALAALMPKNSVVRGIDIGCGANFFVDHVRQTYQWDVVGLDRWKEAIEYGRK